MHYSASSGHKPHWVALMSGPRPKDQKNCSSCHILQTAVHLFFHKKFELVGTITQQEFVLVTPTASTAKCTLTHMVQGKEEKTTLHAVHTDSARQHVPLHVRGFILKYEILGNLCPLK